MKEVILTPYILTEILIYDPASGKLFWKFRPSKFFKQKRDANAWNVKFANTEAFTATDNLGYFRGRIFSKNYLAHRIAWALHTGNWPKGEIDHINQYPSDNRICNLRDVSRPENRQNNSLRKDNKSGMAGVYFSNSDNKWLAEIFVKRKKVLLGGFTNLDDAKLARTDANKKYGYHANHGVLVCK